LPAPHLEVAVGPSKKKKMPRASLESSPSFSNWKTDYAAHDHDGRCINIARGGSCINNFYNEFSGGRYTIPCI
jgi:hypothetical protein